MNPHSSSFGIYIRTFHKDYYLAQVLIESIRAYCPEIEITLIIDDEKDIENGKLWGIPVLQFSNPKLNALKGYFKKFWCFYGPYEKFIYLDADQLTLRSLTPLLEMVKSKEAPFFIANLNDSIQSIMINGADSEIKKLYEARCGDTTLLLELDSDFDYKSTYPFSSGNFASSKNCIELNDLVDILSQASDLHKKQKLAPFDNSREGLFNGDQGLLNYLIYKKEIPLILIDNFYVWGGKSQADHEKHKIKYDPYFVHWGGCPRPTFLNRSVPEGLLWIKYYHSYYKNNPKMSFYKDTFSNILFSSKKGIRDLASTLKSKLKKG